MATSRRLVFGEVAELYDRHRPTYPPELIDDLIALSGTRGRGRALEVGAGTGKATRLLAERGIAVLAIEPSAEMAAVARRVVADEPEVAIVELDFERWDPGDERFRLIYSAQAWHWIDPETRYARARAALETGGLLAVFWNIPAWGDSPLRAALVDAYRATVPDLAPTGPMHPANRTPDHDEHAWSVQLAAAGGFGATEVRRYDWHLTYTGPAYVGMLQTLSEVRLLQERERSALLAAVGAAIEAHSGRLEMPMATVLCLARAV